MVGKPETRLERAVRGQATLPKELGGAQFSTMCKQLAFTVSDGETVFGHGHVIRDWLAADSVNTWHTAAELVLAYVMVGRGRMGRHDGHRHARCRCGSWVCRGVPIDHQEVTY